MSSLAKDDVKTEFVDLHPERDWANADRLGRILGISRRHVFRLADAGVLVRAADGLFHIRSNTARWVEHQLALRDKADNAATDKKAALLQLKLDREDATTMPLFEALAAIDHVTNAFNIALDEIGRQVADLVEDPARAALAVRHAKTDLNKSFGRHRHRLVTGRWPE